MFISPLHHKFYLFPRRPYDGFIVSRCLIDYGTDDKPDDKRRNPAESKRRKRCCCHNSFGKAKTGQARQGFQQRINSNQIYRSFISTVIRYDLHQDAQDEQCQARRITYAKNPADVGDDAIDAEKSCKSRKDAACDGYFFIADLARNGATWPIAVVRQARTTAMPMGTMTHVPTRWIIATSSSARPIDCG